MQGNTKFAFFCENYGEPELQSILSPVCNSVKPICCLWDTVKAPNADSAPRSLDALFAAHAADLASAKQLESSILQANQEQSNVKSWQNSFSTMLNHISSLVHGEKVSTDGAVNEYALNRIQMQSMLSEANAWFAKATQSNASGEEYREMCEKFQKSFDDAMSVFHAKREQELEEERKRKEEEARQAEAEREKKRLAEEEERRAKQRAMVLHWREINQNSYYLSRYISQEDIEFWLRNHNRVIEVGKRPSAPTDLNLALTVSDYQINTEEELSRRAYRLPLNGESKAPRLSFSAPLNSRNVVRLAPTLLYEGDLSEGVPHGNGTLIDATLQQVLYHGQWLNGQFDGTGTRYERGVLVQSGLFRSGALVQGRWIQPSGAILVGTFQGQFLKQGRLVLPSGLWIEGEWQGGQPVGKCVVHVANAIEDLKYDFAHPDEITRYVVVVLEDRVYYNNKYLLDQNPIFLFYFNGDVFIGKANGKDEPVNGVYYYLYNNLYQKLSIGTGFHDENLKDVTYCPILPIKQFDLVLQQEQK